MIFKEAFDMFALFKRGQATPETGKGYGAVYPTPEDAKAIGDWVATLNIKDPLPVNKYHVTLMYDKSNPKVSEDVIGKDASTQTYGAALQDIKTLGEGKWRGAVIMLDSPELKGRFDTLLNSGFTHSYPNFLPHLSLKYVPTPEDIQTLQDNFHTLRAQIPKIVLTRETWSQIKDD